MRVLVAAIVAFVLSGIYTAPIQQDDLPNALVQYRDPVFGVLLLYIVIESVLALWKNAATAAQSGDPATSRSATGNHVRVLLAAILAIAIILVGVTAVPLPLDVTPAKLTAYRYIALILLSGYMVLESVFAFRKSRRVVLPSGDVAETTAKRPPDKAVKPPQPKQEIPHYGEALVFLSVLQEKGRFLDFLMEDITAYNDAQVAAASRVVHQGCAAVIKEYLDIAPVHEGREGERITINNSSDPNRYRLVGKVLGEPPFNGVVVHRGWKTSKLALPRLSRPVNQSAPNIITPAEVEVR